MINRHNLATTLRLVLIIANLGLAATYVSGWTSPVFQSDKKSIIRRVTYFKYPVELSFELEGQPLKSTETERDETGLMIFTLMPIGSNT